MPRRYRTVERVCERCGLSVRFRIALPRGKECFRGLFVQMMPAYECYRCIHVDQIHNTPTEKEKKLDIFRRVLWKARISYKYRRNVLGV